VTTYESVPFWKIVARRRRSARRHRAVVVVSAALAIGSTRISEVETSLPHQSLESSAIVPPGLRVDDVAASVTPFVRTVVRVGVVDDRERLVAHREETRADEDAALDPAFGVRRGAADDARGRVLEDLDAVLVVLRVVVPPLNGTTARPLRVGE